MVRWAMVGLGAMIIAVGVSTAGDGDAPPRWEYRVLGKQQLLTMGKQDLAAGLSELGKQGWELVGIDSVYIFKRRASATTTPTSVEDLKRRLKEAEGNVEAQREHLAWSELMARKGVLSEAYVQTEHRLMKQAEAAAEQARRELDARLLPVPKPLSTAAPKK